MYIHSVKVSNFKSIKNVDNEIIIEPRITAIIGKNESGKSNVVESLSCLSPNYNVSAAFSHENINRLCSSNEEIEYQILLKPKNNKSKIDETEIIINKREYKVQGGLLKYYNSNIKNNVNILIERFPQRPSGFSAQDLNNFKQHKNALQGDDSFDIRNVNKALQFIELKSSVLMIQNGDDIYELFTSIKNSWSELIKRIPTVFFRNSDKILKNEYKLDDIQKEFKNPKAYPHSLLSDFLRLIEISHDDFIKSILPGVSGPKTSLQRKINNNVKKLINDEFNKFYTTEKIQLEVEFDSNVASFSVISDNETALLLSERSNGLRWYLNMFIDAKVQGVDSSNVLYLLDEPGISLHVNAQRELLNLFSDLADKGNQVVYTTHSPYMLDCTDEGIHRIRAVEKDSSGNTRIYKTAYDSKISMENQQDTLAPIINSIGMNLHDTIGPSKDKLNLVVEGVSDYIYLTAMANKLGLDMDKYNIIPSVGVTNSIKLCSILRGWGCPFLAIFDYDREGVEKGGESLREHFLYEEGNEYIYLKEVDNSLLEEKEYQDFSYCIEDLVGKEAIANFVRDEELGSEIGKTLKAKLYCDAVSRGDYSLDSNCENRFSNLFERVEEIRGRLFKI